MGYTNNKMIEGKEKKKIRAVTQQVQSLLGEKTNKVGIFSVESFSSSPERQHNRNYIKY